MLKSTIVLCIVATCLVLAAMPALAAQNWVSLDGSTSPVKPSAVVLSSNERETIIRFTIPGFTVEEVTEDGGIYQVPGFPGCATTRDIGKPQLPRIGELIAIPATANVRVEVTEYTEVIKNGYHVFPFQTPKAEGQQATPLDIDRDFYLLDQFYPSQIAEIGQPSIWRDMRVVDLHVVPVQHNPATGELRILTSLTVTLEYFGTSDKNVLVRSGEPVSARYDKMYRDAILNSDYLSIAVEEDNLSSGRNGYDYLIIAVDDYVDNMQPFIDYKNSRGLATQITPLSTVGADTALIKAYITQEYNANSIKYVLLVGDHEDIPCYELWHYLIYPPPSSCDTVYSDYWYATLTEDDFPEVALGRFSVSNDTEVDNMVNKTIMYESNPPGGDWLQKVLLMTHQDPNRPYEQCKEDIKTAAYTGGSYSVLYPEFDTAYGSQGFTNTDVSAKINDGRRVVNYRGHGGTACWGLVNGWNTYGQDYDTTDVDGLSNGDMTPVVFAICCSSGQFFWPGGRCQGEAFTRGSQAGVAYLGATRPSWTWANNLYDKKIFSSIFDDGINSAGDASNLAAIEIINSYGDEGLDNVRMYLWFGDPSIEVIYYPPEPVVIHVPADQPTIQDAVDIAYTGDTILVAPGTYTGTGNVNVIVENKEVTIISEDGPEHTIIDCEDQSRAFSFDTDSELNGFTIKNGNSLGLAVHHGGALLLTGSPAILNCVFKNCEAEYGGAINVVALRHPTFENCTIVDNTADRGAGIAFSRVTDATVMNRCIIAFNNGEGLHNVNTVGTLTYECNVFFSNAGGDIVGIEGDGVDNQNADPQFCDRPAGNYMINVDSPCAPAGSLCGELIGALDTGCSDNDYWKVEIPTIENGYMGMMVPVSVYLTAPAVPFDLGYIDIRVKYHPTTMTLVNAVPGEFLNECGWEYFTWRIKSSPQHHWRIYSHADLDNGQTPSCFYPDGKRELYVLTFLLTTNPYWEDIYSQVQFYWPDGVEDQCLVNTFKDRSMENILNGHKVYTFLGTEMPTGWPDLLPYPECDTAGTAAIDFYNGAIHFVNLLGADVRGDVNLNGVRFEIGDLITFQNYFIIGLDAFFHDVAMQIEATDLNCDGLYLTIADFIYLGRIVFGWVDPPCPGWLPSGKGDDQPRLALSDEFDTLSVGNHSAEPGDQNEAIHISLSNESELGGFQARFEFDPDVLSPDWDVLLQDGVSVTYQLVGRAADYEANGGDVVVQCRTEGELLIYFIPDDNITATVPAGSGTILNVIFDIPSSAPSGFSLIPVVDDGYYVNNLSDVEGRAITPELDGGHIIIIEEVPPSCPVLFVDNGQGYVEENPLLTACELSNYTETVVDFYHVMNPVFEDNGVVRFQLREMEDEITYLNDIQLITVDHTAESQVAVSVDGQIGAYDDVVPPLTATDHTGSDVLTYVSEEDGASYTSSEPGHIVVEFPVNPDAGPSFIGVPPIEKRLCPLKPEEDGIPIPDAPNEIVVEYLDAEGNWTAGPDIPSRTVTGTTVLPYDESMVSGQSVATVRISWSDHIEIDILCQYVSSSDDARLQKWTISESNLNASTEDNFTDGAVGSKSQLVLKKNDVFEFEFSVDGQLADGMIRDYVIMAVGRYQPDYSVYTNLLPGQFQLYDNYPNPFNPSTTISYDLPDEARVRVDVYNVLGQHITTLVDDWQKAGHHETVWNSMDNNGNAVASGVYFYRLTTDNFVESKKMMLLK